MEHKDSGFRCLFSRFDNEGIYPKSHEWLKAENVLDECIPLIMKMRKKEMMSEYMRTQTHQFCDTELCMVLDKVTGTPKRAFKSGNSIGPLFEALEYLKDAKCLDRLIIVKIECIKSFARES